MPRGMESSMNDADGNNLIKSQTLNTVIQFSFKPTFYFFSIKLHNFSHTLWNMSA